MFESRLQSERVDLLAKAFLAMESVEDCYRLFEDLFTIREVQDLSSRMEIALMLHDKTTLDRMWILRKYIADMNPLEAMNLMQQRMQDTRNNEEFFMSMNS